MATYPSGGRERVEFWQQRINHAAERMKPYFAASDILVKQYANEATTDRERDYAQDPQSSRVKASLIFGWIDQSIANLLERHPHFSIKPLSPEAAQGNRVVEAVSNYWYRETDQLRQDERILLDAFLTPYGVKKLGWSTDIEQRVFDLVQEPEADFGNDVENDLLALLSGTRTRVTNEQDHEVHIETKTRFLQQPGEDMPEEIVGIIEDNVDMHRRMQDRPQPDPNTTIHWESPFGQRWKPQHFFVDPLAQDGIKDAQWIAFKSVRRLEDVKMNPNYNHTQDLKGNTRPDDAPVPTGSEDMRSEDDFGLVTLYEVWARDFPLSNSKRKNCLIVFAEGHDKPLREEEEWPYSTLEDFPVEVLCFTSTINEWFAKPTLSMAGGDNIQTLSNEILDSFLYVTRKQKNVILYDPDVVESDTIDNLIIAPDMSAHPVRGLSGHSGAAVQALNLGRVQGEKGELLSLMQSLFDRAAGTPQPVSLSVDSATEASIIERRTTAREARRGNLLAEFQVRTARKFWQMTTQFRPEKLFLVHPQAGEWAAVDEEIVKGEYRFTVDVSSGAQALALERKNWSDVLNLFSGLAGLFQQLYGPEAMPNLQKIAERLLVRGFNEMSPEEILPGLATQGGEEPNSPEMQAQIQQMLTGTPGEAPTEGPTTEGPPTETESGARAGAALPRQFRDPLPSGAAIQGSAQSP
jgi:hypothetical protein